MSSKPKTTARKEEATPALLPKLRFPEFRKAQGWTGVQLGSKTNKVGSGITPTGGDKNYKLSGRPFVRSQNIGWGVLLLGDVAFIDEETHNSFSSTQIEVFDVLLNITGASIGRSAVADARIKGGNVNQHVCIIRVKPEELSPCLLNQYLISHDGQKQIDSFQAGGNRQGLNFEQIRSFLIPLPAAFPEQQKIGECLSSVDELIAAQARKVDALKTHKKGLMQQLFPREGESQPRLRFPEFQNAGEWLVKKLGEFADVAASGDLDSELFSPIKTNICCYPVYSNAVEQEGLYGYYSLPKYPANCVTITARGTLGVAFLRHANFMGIGRLLVLNFNQGIDSRFMKDCWNHLAKIPQEVTSIPQLTAVTARMTIFPIPSLEEQQRIATCLSSIDTLITAETQKLEALKTHKKGLMQQLFPSPGETLP